MGGGFGIGSLQEPDGKAVDLKIIRMSGIPLLAVIGFVMLSPQGSFAQG
jgi:hypothetical protein